MSSSIDGLVSGLDTTGLIKQLIAAERVSQDRLVAKRDQAKQDIAAYQALNTRLAALRDAAASLSEASGWNVMKGASTAPTVATVTAGASALGGSLSFTVNQLATSATIVSAGTVPALSSLVATPGSSFLVSAGGPALGIGTFGGAGLTLGAHTLKVTQASAGASKTGTTAVAPSVVVDGTNDALTVEIDGGAPVTFNIAHGTYSASALATAVQTASAGALKATVDGNGKLVLQTTDEGSVATLRVDPTSTALVALGFTGAEVGGAASTGADGVLNIDGTAHTLSDVRAGVSTGPLASGTGGTVTVDLSGGLRLGTVNAKNVSTGDGSLSAIVNAVNQANAGVTAAAIQSAPGQFKLQLASSGSGLAGAVSTSTAGLTMGAFNTIGTAQDATITVGNGAGAFTVNSSTNSIGTLLPGVSINLLTTGAATVTVSRDADGMATKVASFVDAANAALNDIKTLTAYDPDTGTSGILMGDFTVRTLQNNIIAAITGSVTTSTVTTAASAGVSITKTGTFTFDKAKFVAAYNANPDEVGKLFQRGGSSLSADVSLASSTHKTRAGAYPVVVTQAATQATATGTVLGGGTITAAEMIEVRVGGATGTTISYSALAGATLTSIADGLNAAAANAGVGILASVQGNALVVNSSGYGANASFEIRTSNVDPGQTGIGTLVYATKAGTNVAGTINGVAATGIGRLLQAPPTNATLAGLTLTITSTAADVAGAGGTLNLGNFTYVPGVAQRVATAGVDAIDVVSGTMTAAIDGRKRLVTDLDKQIEVWDRRLADRQLALKRQFSAMETALSSMRQQSNWLAGQVNSLNAINSQGGN